MRRILCSAFWLLPVLAALLLSASTTHADSLTVTVVDRNNQPVADVLVLVDAAPSKEPSGGYVMDQVNMAFAPHVLVVPLGASVSFPNSDPVAHHVYSFSRPNQFTLPLYRGQLPNPVTFEHPGVVELGCNIHDGMVGYIVVKNGQAHAWTDADGTARFELSDTSGATRADIWSPRIRKRGEVLSQAVEGASSLRFALKRGLLAPHAAHHQDDY